MSGDCLTQDGAVGREYGAKHETQLIIVPMTLCSLCGERHVQRPRHARPVLPGDDESRFDNWARRHFEAKRTSMDQKSSQLSDHAGDNISSAPLAAYIAVGTRRVSMTATPRAGQYIRSISSLQGAWLTDTHHSRRLALKLTRKRGHWCTHSDVHVRMHNNLDRGDFFHNNIVNISASVLHWWQGNEVLKRNTVFLRERR